MATDSETFHQFDENSQKKRVSTESGSEVALEVSHSHLASARWHWPG